jgi:hypothetical protein
LCCGSESGDFVAMRLDEGNEDNEDPLSGIDPETRLYLGLDAYPNDPVFSLISRARRSQKNMIAKSMKLAKDRVNCITLWFPPTTMLANAKAYREPVAVLANNDRTVTLVSLRDFDEKDKTEALDIITYPDFVNRSLLSPDGRFLISILDDPYMYIHERVRKTAESPDHKIFQSNSKDPDLTLEAHHSSDIERIYKSIHYDFNRSSYSKSEAWRTDNIDTRLASTLINWLSQVHASCTPSSTW